MLSLLRSLVDLGVKGFALGLFVMIVLNWLGPPGLREVQTRLTRFYDRFLDPIRRHLRPVRLFPSAPGALDLSPLVLLLLLWLLAHPFLMWVLS